MINISKRWASNAAGLWVSGSKGEKIWVYYETLIDFIFSSI